MSMPSWLKVNINLEEMQRLHKLFNNHGVSTICWNADCPNISECYSKKTATFLLMGDVCTRNCGFCSVKKGKPSKLDFCEAESIKKAVLNLNLNYIVLTTVTRDDLPDGGAAYIYYVINKLKTSGYSLVEILMPDFKGGRNSIDLVISSKPVVIGHNLETVEPLYPVVRPIADYKRSVEILEYIKKKEPSISTKSSLILGLGEVEKDVKKTIRDLVSTNLDILIIGQYLQPSKDNLRVKEYVEPKKFYDLRQFALTAGIKYVVSEPLARTSYKAFDIYNKLKRRLIYEV